MLGTEYDVILDLATDTSDSICDQLVSEIKNKLNGSTKHTVSVLSKGWTQSPFPEGRLFVSDNLVDLMLKAKNDLDDSKVTNFVLVTSLIMKKYWETMCLHMCSHIHRWSVVGVDVTGQSLEVQAPSLDSVEDNIKEHLKTIGDPGDVRIHRSKLIPDMFNAGFHERFGGVTHFSPMASLNMLYTIRKPDPLLVILENRRRLADSAGFDLNSLHIAKTVHGKDIWVVGKEAPIKYDGVVTNIPGVTVAAPGADCSMILLADTKTGACGAVHAGWMGTTLGAVRSCLKAMVDEFGTDPKDVHAAIGPSIEANCFDLGVSEASVLSDLDPSLTTPIEGRPGLVRADLVRANAVMLEKDGVPRNNIDTELAYCTACDTRFFSHRRDAIPFGNQIGFISCRNSQKSES